MMFRLIAIFGLVLSFHQCFALENAFNLFQVNAGSDEEKGLMRSMALNPPHLTRYTSDQIQEIARQATAQNKYPDADAIILMNHDRTAFDEEGYYHLVQQDAVKILNENGVSRFANVELSYALPYNRIRILEAYIISPDGLVTAVLPSEILDISDSEGVSANIYEPIWRNKVIPFPLVETGAVIYYCYEDFAVKPIMQGVFNWGHTFNGTDPVYDVSICLEGPKSKPFYWYVSNNERQRIAYQDSISDNRKIYCWEARSPERIIPEPGMIPIEEISANLYISTETWKEFSAREYALTAPNLTPDEAIRQKTLELIENCESPMEKVQALFHYVTKKVRYVGLTFGDRPGRQPDPVVRTFTNSSGVCKDKAGLLTSMLTIAGIEAHYTLHNPEYRICTMVAVDQFNHAIVSVKLPDETAFRYLDVTTDLERSMLPAYSGGTIALRICPEGADPETIPVTDPDDNAGYIDAYTWLNKNGGLTSRLYFTGKGVQETLFRELFYYQDSARHIEVMQNFVKNISSSARLLCFELHPEELDDLRYPFEFELIYRAPDYLVNTGTISLFKAPGTLQAFDWIFRDLSDLAALAQRKWPINLDSTSSMHITETVFIPEGFRIKTVPEAISSERETICFTQTHHQEGTKIVMKQSLKVLKPRIGVKEYGSFKESLATIKKASRSFIVLEKQP